MAVSVKEGICPHFYWKVCLNRMNLKTTQRYCRVSNNKAQRDYYKAMEKILKRVVDGFA